MKYEAVNVMDFVDLAEITFCMVVHHFLSTSDDYDKILSILCDQDQLAGYQRVEIL